MEVVKEKKDIQNMVEKIAKDILKEDLNNTVLIGIRTGGAFLASRIKKIIKNMGGGDLPLGVLDITLYRDDWTRIGPAPIVRKTEIPFTVDDKTVVLIDDVLFTGRTVRAAIDAILDYGRPKKIKLAVLIDRGKKSRELPICADYIGDTIETSLQETINVYLREQGHEEMVVVEEIER